jgi:phosphotransferase family enzyme
MIVEPFAADPAFPGLEAAGDPDSMRRLFGVYLRPAGETAYSIRDCRLSRVRYRKGRRCVLQYALSLVHPVTGSERTQWVTGVMYTGNKSRRKWEKLLKSAPEVPGADPAFEPFAFVPELDMLVEVFPYDRRLPGLPFLMAGPSHELEAPLLTHFGPGWRIEAWNVELVRYRAELGATARISVRAEEATTGRAVERRFYAKVYHDDGGGRTHRVLRTLRDRPRDGTAFSVGSPVAYLDDLRTLIQEETPGVTLRDVLLVDEDAGSAVRKAAAALAELHLADVEPPRLHPLVKEVIALERTGRLLRWACPHLVARIEEIVGAVISDLEEVPPAPTHLDLKLDHILLDRECIGLIDLDGFAGADPLLDAAGIMAHLGGISLLFPGFDEERGRDYERAFADEYFGRVPEAWRDRLPVHYAGGALKMAVGFFRRREAGWPAKIESLLNTAEESLMGWTPR